MFSQMRHTLAPFSPPPSPPKSEIWSATKDVKTHSYHFTEISPKSSNTNEICAVRQLLNDVDNPCNSYFKTSTICENGPNHFKKHQIHETQSETFNVVEKPQNETKKLSKMSINFMLDDSHDEEEPVNVPSSSSSSSSEYESKLGKEIDRRVYAGRKRRGRKNPYPMRAPSKDVPGINVKVDVYIKGSTVILHRNDTFHYLPSTKSSVETNEVVKKPIPGPKNTGKPLVIRQQRPKEALIRRSGVSKPERKRKGNSLARVMADRGLLESISNTDITSTDIKSVRIPPPLPMQHQELMEAIKELNIDLSVLNNHTPNISWKGQPLNITHLPHYEELHEAEAKVVSILRLTPVQYLTGKHTLVSAAKRYAQKALPFKKSDAQKLLRIDVNKASKLWEFFHQIRWI